MSTVVSDPFNRANANPIGGIYNGVLSGNAFAVQLSSNVAEATSASNLNVGIDITNTYTNDQWSKVVVGAIAAGGVISAIVRTTAWASPGAWNYAAFAATQGTTAAHLFITVGGIQTAAVNITLNTNPAANDIYYLTVQGQVYTCYQNGAQVEQYTDASVLLTSGQPGFGINANATLAANTVSLFQGGSLLSVVAVSAASQTSVTSLATSPGITTTTGYAGVCFLQTVSAQPLSTFTDTAGNTWNGTGTPAFNLTSGGVHFFVYLLWAQNITGGTNQVYTATVSGGTAKISFNVMLFPGRATTGTLFDGSVGTFSDSINATSHTGPPVTTSFRNSYIAAMGFDVPETIDNFTPGSNYTVASVNNGTGSTYFPGFSQYQLAANAGSYNAPWTTSNSGLGIGICVALLAPVTATGGNLTMMGMG